MGKIKEGKKQKYVEQKQKQTTQVAIQVSKNSIIINTFLALAKVMAGLLASSGAMVADGIHSASDVFSSIIVIIGIKLSQKEADEEHPYGHERMECVAAIGLAVVLLFTGLGIGYNGIEKIRNAKEGVFVIPGILALYAAIVSMAVKEGMYWYTRHFAKKINSGALMADAWHHRSDALSSAGSFIGILGARLGYPIMDSLASLIICLFIVKASYDIFKEAIDKMVDKACEDEITEQIRGLVSGQQGVIRIDELITREFGNRIYVDLEIAADGSSTLREAHAIAENIHAQVEREMPIVKHIMIHVNPDHDLK